MQKEMENSMSKMFFSIQQKRIIFILPSSKKDKNVL